MGIERLALRFLSQSPRKMYLSLKVPPRKNDAQLLNTEVIDSNFISLETNKLLFDRQENPEGMPMYLKLQGNLTLSFESNETQRMFERAPRLRMGLRQRPPLQTLPPFAPW